jgi:uncharacterized cysteine cluster protein YcgN (CxxCxxCC family)
MADKELPFWKRKKLTEMTLDEWESLCDGCAKCCLHKLEYDNQEYAYTNVACHLLDTKTCRCSNYPERTLLVPDCVELMPRNLPSLAWMPPTCAYLLIHQGKDLPDWHPLVSGDPASVRKAGISAHDRILSERDVEDLEDHIVDWPADTVEEAAKRNKTRNKPRARR